MKSLTLIILKGIIPNSIILKGAVMKLQKLLFRASVARNFAWALPKQKGTVK
ncbi:MAG: hypothetical protein GXP61_04765 [Epsilonproteobacteria bacterium]|nr:hypothetical protein [Campylobacterota bacterium]